VSKLSRRNCSNITVTLLYLGNPEKCLRLFNTPRNKHFETGQLKVFSTENWPKLLMSPQYSTFWKTVYTSFISGVVGRKLQISNRILANLRQSTLRVLKSSILPLNFCQNLGCQCQILHFWITSYQTRKRFCDSGKFRGNHPPPPGPAMTPLCFPHNWDATYGNYYYYLDTVDEYLRHLHSISLLLRHGTNTANNVVEML